MTVHVNRGQGAYDDVSVYGEISDKTMVVKSIGGQDILTFTLTATNRSQSDRLLTRCQTWIGLTVTDTEWGWENDGEICQIDMRLGYDTARISRIDGFSNRVAFVYEEEVVWVQNQKSVDRIGKWEYMASATRSSEFTSAMATDEANTELRMRQSEEPYDLEADVDFQEYLSVTITVLGEFAMLARYVAHVNFSHKAEDSADLKVSTLIKDIVTNDTPVSVGRIVENSETIDKDAQMSGSTVHARLSSLASRNENGDYRIHVHNGKLYYAPVMSTERIMTVRADGIYHGGRKVEKRGWKDGFYWSQLTGNAVFCNEISITDAPIPSRSVSRSIDGGTGGSSVFGDSRRPTGYFSHTTIKGILDTNGQLPHSANFSTGGGKFLLMVSGSGFNNSGPDGLIGMTIKVNGAIKGYSRTYANENLSHKAFVPAFIVIDDVGAGEHTLSLEQWSNTSTDSNDFFFAAVLSM